MLAYMTSTNSVQQTRDRLVEQRKDVGAQQRTWTVRMGNEVAQHVGVLIDVTPTHANFTTSLGKKSLVFSKFDAANREYIRQVLRDRGECIPASLSADDDVTLILKAIGAHSFYQHNTLSDQIRSFVDNSAFPHLMVLGKELEDAKLAALYRGSNAFVLPYRGEGFGMPIAEAMACGKPVVTTALGPAREFCPSEIGYLIPAQVVPVPDDSPPLGELTGKLTWFEPDIGKLARTLRHIYENREEAARRGAAGAHAIRSTHSWNRVNQMYLERIRRLVSAPEQAPSDLLSLVGAR